MSNGTGRFRRADRLLRSREFQHVTRRGRRAADRDFVVVLTRRDLSAQIAAPRLGVAVSRKVGNAVVRNHVKRRVREWFRSFRSELGRGVDIVVIARAPAALLSSSELRASLGGLLHRLQEARA